MERAHFVGEDPLRPNVKVRGLAIAAVAALSGLGIIGLASPASAATAKPYDFNGDGFTDLAIGSPFGTVNSKASAGFVSVIYGSSAGFNTGKKQVFTQDLSWVPGAAEATDHFGYSLASADFDGDGFADLAVGTPDEDTGHGANAGYLTILWGSATGLTEATATEEFDTPGAGHRFGESLSAGDINRDGFPELWFTIPGTGQFSGIIFGPAAAAKATSGPARRTNLRRVKLQSPASVEHLKSARTGKAAKGEVSTLSATDVTNSWLATGDVTGDQLEDVVYAWYDADAATADDQHGFVVYPGTATGDVDPDTAFGFVGVDVNALTLGDFDGNGFADVALGQTPDADHLGGQVAVFKGAAADTFGEAYVLNQETQQVEGSGEAGDAFGASVAAGDINKDGRADLAVGVPTEDVNSVKDGGSTILFYGSATGLTGAGSQVITQNTAGVPGTCEAGDKLGTQVTLLDNNNDGFADLAAGAPTEDVSEGMISWLGGTASGATGTGSLGLTSGTIGLPAHHAEMGRRLGRLG